MAEEESKIPRQAFALRKGATKDVRAYLEDQGLSPGMGADEHEFVGPPVGQPNSIICRICGKSEYRSKTHCACGAYLRGQIEDEYFQWKQSWEESLDQKSREAENIARWLSLICGFSALVAVLLYFFGVINYISSKVSPLYYFAGVLALFILYKASMYHDEKSKALLREKDTLTFLHISC